jgi:DNA-3-methyladenine glycosylase II
MVTLFVAQWDTARAYWAERDWALHAAAPPTPVARPLDPEQTPFGALATAITHQQVSMAAGRSIARRVVAACDGRWEAAAIAALTEEELRGAGLSRAKVRYIRALAEADLRGELAGLERETDEAAIRRLVAMPGIGVWSAKMFLLFHLQRPDVFSGDDLGLRLGIKLVDNLLEPPTARAAEARAEVWSPYRSVASLVLWDLVRQSRLT